MEGIRQVFSLTGLSGGLYVFQTLGEETLHFEVTGDHFESIELDRDEVSKLINVLQRWSTQDAVEQLDEAGALGDAFEEER